jgi:hypothetical protein
MTIKKKRPDIAANNQKRESWKVCQGHQTGPRTEAGKRASSLRFSIHGGTGRGASALKGYIASVNRLLRALKQ